MDTLHKVVPRFKAPIQTPLTVLGLIIDLYHRHKCVTSISR